MIISRPKSLLPDNKGFYGQYGGRYVPEIIYPNILELDKVFQACIGSDDFWQEYVALLQEYSGRPTPITYCQRLTEKLGGAKVYLKREDLNHSGAHKMNNVLGQGLIAKKLGKTRVIAETGAGQHGVATAIMAAKFGFDATIYMGAEDVERQRPNVFWMERMGAKVIPVDTGSRTLKDAINEAMKDWSTNLDNTHYVLGTACGPHPFPAMVAFFQSIIGLEASKQLNQLSINISKVYACVGGGSNALGSFQGFLDTDVELVAVEAGGKGTMPGEHASRMAGGQGSVGIAQGYKTIFLQDEHGQMLDTHSVSAGLDYVGISPIIADLVDRNLVRIERASDYEVISSAEMLMKLEGIIPALESSHAVACAVREVGAMSPDESVLVNLSGRGDKDIFTFADIWDDEEWDKFIWQKAERS